MYMYMHVYNTKRKPDYLSCGTRNRAAIGVGNYNVHVHMHTNHLD